MDPSEPQIIDIRSSDVCPLDKLDVSIIDGLTRPHGQKTLPSLLLWDEKGQELYSDILTTHEYYPYRVEHELIQERVGEMAGAIALCGTDLLVELGAGNMTKTAQLLSHLDGHLSAPITYYALDVDRAQMESSLAQLAAGTQLRWIRLCGLLGTYDDGAKFFAQPAMAAFRRSLVWMGSSITNCGQPGASRLLESFAQDPDNGTPQNLAGFLLLVDGCQDAGRIETAYDVPNGSTRRWMLHAIDAARHHLGGSGGDGDHSDVDRLLAAENWRFEGQWYPEQQRYVTSLVPTRDMVGVIQGRHICLEQGERVELLETGKWTEKTIASVASAPGLEVRKAWHHDEVKYGAYWLQPMIRRHDSGIDMMEMSEAPVKRTSRGVLDL
ncbi:hypothetical protein N658DRAFT_430345 [Parathielavia hyrcaniae]|uniref:Histidine-specific methyltransferase SAM-dependent domain-containing protein n=1 Tax=Parathielavia hyrcaniae TaxID=113614 RepID=A0AAN6T056_9PEZI|nr:hypothetical protein N658DRAFT_430345 [Parathielavia hyrcaniae]